MFKLLILLTWIKIKAVESNNGIGNTTLFDNETMVEYHKKQNRLISHVFTEYRKDVPPIYIRGRWTPTGAEPTLVNITLMYAKLLSINEPEQTVDVIFEYELYWNDARLSWDPSEFDNIKGFYTNRELVWRPDLIPYDSRSILDTRDPDLQHVYVNYDGQMEFYVSSVVSFACPIDIRKFPFDKQVCVMNYCSYNFPSEEIRIVASIYKNYNISYASNGEWTVDKLTFKTGTTDYSFDMATFTFHLRRSSIFYVVLIIIPSFVLTFLCVLGLFWSKFDHNDYLEKLGLGFAAILAMCMVLEIAEESVPKTRQLPILSIYIMVNLLLVTISISIVVMASKSCDLFCSSKTRENPKKSGETSKKSLRPFGFEFCVKFRVICLVLFPLASVVNLLVLVINV